MPTVFLSKALGLYLLIAGSIALTNKKRLQTLQASMLENHALLLVSGAFTLILGILIVISHNVWTPDWRILITLLGWITLFKGIYLMAAPQRLAKFSKKLWKGNRINFILGLYILLGGFLAFMGFAD